MFVIVAGMYCRWRPARQSGHVDRINPATCLCLSQSRTSTFQRYASYFAFDCVQWFAAINV